MLNFYIMFKLCASKGSLKIVRLKKFGRTVHVYTAFMYVCLLLKTGTLQIHVTENVYMYTLI